MSKRNRRRKPMDPQAIAEARAKKLAEIKDAEKRLEFGLNLDAIRLIANGDVRVVTDKKTGKAQIAHRDDVFDRLIKSQVAMKAVRRLENDLAEQMGQSWRPGERVSVDTSQFPPGQNVSQASINAGKRVSQALALTGRKCALILRDLITRADHGFPAPVNDNGEERPKRPAERITTPFDWRLVVQTLTGEVNEHAQAARVRAACDNLASAYELIDKRRLPKPDNDQGARISA